MSESKTSPCKVSIIEVGLLQNEPHKYVPSKSATSNQSFKMSKYKVSSAIEPLYTSVSVSSGWAPSKLAPSRLELLS